MSPSPWLLVRVGFFLVLMTVFAVARMSSNRPGSALPLIGVIIVAGIVVLVVVVWQRHAQKRTVETRIGETRTVIREQLDAIAEDILELDDEVRAAGNDEALTWYRNATSIYTAALGEVETADTTAELTDMATQLDVAIWHLDMIEALLDGNPLPAKPRTKPAAAAATDGSGYQRRAGRESCIGVSDMIAAILGDGPKPGRTRPRDTRGQSRRGGKGIGPMRMGPMGMMGGHRRQNHDRDEGALGVLQRRYAEGELTDEEFDVKRRELEGRTT